MVCIEVLCEKKLSYSGIAARFLLTKIDQKCIIAHEGHFFEKAWCLVASTYPLCRAWYGLYSGDPLEDGEGDHLLHDGLVEDTLVENRLYWMGGMCLHESLPAPEDTKRQFMRISMPSTGAWFEGYTKNPLGIKPTGVIMSKRRFMKAQ